jgi:hypothetical protein
MSLEFHNGVVAACVQDVAREAVGASGNRRPVSELSECDSEFLFSKSPVRRPGRVGQALG